MTLALCRDVSQCGETVYSAYGRLIRVMGTLKPGAWADYGLLKSGLRLVYLLSIFHRGNNNGECYNESLPVVPSLPAAREELKASVYFPGQLSRLGVRARLQLLSSDVAGQGGQGPEGEAYP
jgi:hypothetical protein